MKSAKMFIKVATNIEYYGENQLSWYQRLFYNPPRQFRSNVYRTTRNKAYSLRVPPHYQFGMRFDVSSYTATTNRITI